MSNNRQHILKVLAYFDIFHYPVTKDEIRSFLCKDLCQLLVDEALQNLLVEKRIFKLDEFYSLRNEPSLASRRTKGNMLAMKEIFNAKRAANILARFPYVKGLAISGSLSKNFADENSDIDFFIITEANRLWIARTMLQLFYKMAYLVGKRRWFCLNYYVDEQGLEITEKNIFTAMEIVTLLPMHGPLVLDDFLVTNSWTREYFPQHQSLNHTARVIKKNVFSNLFEQLFNTGAGDQLDDWLMKITRRRWQKKVQHHQVNEKGICIGMLVNKHYSKPDPLNFQTSIIDQYQRRVLQLLPVQENVIEGVN